jgi:tRNA(Ile2) C34 agmatinyltransferase TiaS
VKALEFQGNVGKQPEVCDHCGGQTESIGLVAPRCTACGEFSLSHISFGPPEVVEVDLRIEVEG